MGRVGAYVVTKNEANNYLPRMLEDLVSKVDGVAVYDDCSEDDTVDIAKQFGCSVTVRESHIPTFDTHEGQFRQAAWDWSAWALDLEPHDWLLAIDADEWFLSEQGNVGFLDRLHIFLDSIPDHYTSVLIQKYEVFAINDGVPWIRTDGYWGRMIGTRLARWLPGGKFTDKKMGSGCEPTYAPTQPFRRAGGFYLLHYGYSTVAAQRAKHLRYSTFPDHGHSQSHINSIVGPAQLKKFDLPYPELSDA